MTNALPKCNLLPGSEPCASARKHDMATACPGIAAGACKSEHQRTLQPRGQKAVAAMSALLKK